MILQHKAVAPATLLLLLLLCLAPSISSLPSALSSHAGSPWCVSRLPSSPLGPRPLVCRRSPSVFPPPPPPSPSSSRPSFFLRSSSLRGGASKRISTGSSAPSSSSDVKKKGLVVGGISSRRGASSSSKKGPPPSSPSRRRLPSPSVLSSLYLRYRSIAPVTRAYMSVCIVLSLSILLLGDEVSQRLFAFSPSLAFPFQPWRLLTAGCYLGSPSISSLMSVYYLFEYGSSLESMHGSASFLYFLFLQLGLLSLMSSIMSVPFFGSALITSMLHVLSRQYPNQKVKWLVFTVPYWTLPLGLAVTDVLQTQTGASLVPHVMGILSGHVYHFWQHVWTEVGGGTPVGTPAFLQRLFDKDGTAATRSNKTSKTRDDEWEDAMNKAKKNRKIKRKDIAKGRRIGGEEE